MPHFDVDARTLAIALLGALLTSACPPPTPLSRCENDEECPTGYRCQRNVCLSVLADDAGAAQEEGGTEEGGTEEGGTEDSSGPCDPNQLAACDPLTVCVGGRCLAITMLTIQMERDLLPYVGTFTHANVVVTTVDMSTATLNESDGVVYVSGDTEVVAHRSPDNLVAIGTGEALVHATFNGYVGTPKLLRVRPPITGTTCPTQATTIDATGWTGLCCNPRSELCYAVDPSSGGSLLELDSHFVATGATIPLTGLPQPVACSVHPRDNTLYVASATMPTIGAVDLATGQRDDIPVKGLTENIVGVAVDPLWKLLLITTQSSNAFILRSDGDRVWPYLARLPFVGSLGRVAIDPENGQTAFFELNPDANQQLSLADTSLVEYRFSTVLNASGEIRGASFTRSAGQLAILLADQVYTRTCATTDAALVGLDIPELTPGQVQGYANPVTKARVQLQTDDFTVAPQLGFALGSFPEDVTSVDSLSFTQRTTGSVQIRLLGHGVASLPYTLTTPYLFSEATRLPCGGADAISDVASIGANGLAFACLDPEAGTIFVVDENSDYQEIPASNAAGLAVDPADTVTDPSVAYFYNRASGNLVQHPLDGMPELTFNPGLELSGLCWDEDNGWLWGVSAPGGTLVAYDPDDSFSQMNGSPIDGLTGGAVVDIACVPGGARYFSTREGWVNHLDNIAASPDYVLSAWGFGHVFPGPGIGYDRSTGQLMIGVAGGQVVWVTGGP